jgi:hypothetical protein
MADLPLREAARQLFYDYSRIRTCMTDQTTLEGNRARSLDAARPSGSGRSIFAGRKA